MILVGRIRFYKLMHYYPFIAIGIFDVKNVFGIKPMVFKSGHEDISSNKVLLLIVTSKIKLTMMIV